MESDKNSGGRPTKYNERFVKEAYKLCLLGATDKDLAVFFEVNPDTINEWKKVYPEFSESLKRGKIMADAEVSKALFKRATGYKHPDVDIRVCDGMVVQTKIEKHYPPDSTAIIFWLKNRQPDTWRDKQELDLSSKGKELKSFTLNVKPDTDE